MNRHLLPFWSFLPAMLIAAPANALDPVPTIAPNAVSSAASSEILTPASIAASTTESSVAAPNAQEILTWQIYAGLQTQLRRPRGSDFAHRIRYKDKPVGKQDKDLSVLSVTGEFGKTGAAEEVDSPDLLIDFEKGEGVSQSGLLEFLNVNPNFKFNPLKSYPLRTTTQAAANFQAKTYSVAFGVETPSFKLSQIGIGDGTNLSNWLTLGLAANQKWRPAAAGGDKFSGIVTYRGFVGKAWGFHQVEKLEFTLDQVFASGTAATFSELKTWDTMTSGAARRSSKLNIFLDAVVNSEDFQKALQETNHPLRNDSNYRARVKNQFNRLLAGTYERDPSLSIHLESAGWYNLSRVPNEKRLNSGTALAITKWFSAGKTAPRSSLQARIDYGRAFSNSTQPQRTASLILGLNF